jgi:hypothetical protein
LPQVVDDPLPGARPAEEAALPGGAGLEVPERPKDLQEAGLPRRPGRGQQAVDQGGRVVG